MTSRITLSSADTRDFNTSMIDFLRPFRLRRRTCVGKVCAMKVVYYEFLSYLTPMETVTFSGS